ncbi:hypothetical protein DD600_26945, partial [Enterobacter cloacae]
MVKYTDYRYQGSKFVLDNLRSYLEQFGPSMLSVPVKLEPFVLNHQVLEQLLSWQLRQALQEGELTF